MLDGLPEIMAGGQVALARLRERQAEGDRILSEVLGTDVAQWVSKDKTFLTLILPVLHSDGKDMEAVARLQKAVREHPDFMSRKIGTVRSKEDSVD